MDWDDGVAPRMRGGPVGFAPVARSNTGSYYDIHREETQRPASMYRQVAPLPTHVYDEPLTTHASQDPVAHQYWSYDDRAARVQARAEGGPRALIQDDPSFQQAYENSLNIPGNDIWVQINSRRYERGPDGRPFRTWDQVANESMAQLGPYINEIQDPAERAKIISDTRVVFYTLSNLVTDPATKQHLLNGVEQLGGIGLVGKARRRKSRKSRKGRKRTIRRK